MASQTTFGASIVPTERPLSYLPDPATDSPALTPAVSANSFNREYTGSHIAPTSPFYQHPPSSNEAVVSSKAHTKAHIDIYEKDIESANDAPLTPASHDDNPFAQKLDVEQNKECSMWPSRQTLQQKHKQEKTQRRLKKKGVFAPITNQWVLLSKRNRLLVKIATAVFVIGVAVALGVGISIAVKGSYFAGDGKNQSIGA